MVYHKIALLFCTASLCLIDMNIIATLTTKTPVPTVLFSIIWWIGMGIGVLLLGVALALIVLAVMRKRSPQLQGPSKLEADTPPISPMPSFNLPPADEPVTPDSPMPSFNLPLADEPVTPEQLLLPAPSRFRLWIIEDDPRHIAHVEQSLPPDIRQILAVQSFIVPQDCLNTFTTLCAKAPDRLPDFILLDYFLGSMHGDEVLSKLLATYEQYGLPRAVIIAHSSNMYNNAELVRQGADFSVLKDRSQIGNPMIRHIFGSEEALIWLQEHRQKMPINP